MKAMSEFREVVIAGMGITPFGFYEETPWYIHGSEAIFKCLEDADTEWKEIQAAFCGSVYQGTGSGHQAILEVGQTGIPVVNVENACSSFASALRLAHQSVAAEIYDIVIAVGFEKMPRGPIPSTAFRPWQLALGYNVQPANYANEAVEYMEKTGATVEDFSLVTVKNRKNAALNPNARFQQPVTLEEVTNSRMIAYPLRLLHCCPLAHGGAAALVCSRDKVKHPEKAATIAACVLTSGVYGEESFGTGTVESLKFKPKLGIIELSVKQAYELAGNGPEDMDLIQAYDTMSPAELWDIEKMGFCQTGEVPGLLREGAFDIGGKLPVNTDGGLMGRGHPLGATAGGQIYEIYSQILGRAGPRQVEGAKIGLAHAMGAGPNSAITILKR